ncbi:MAG: GNAT family N-acetyltransferase [Deltaproteobacteria bacterium]
MGDENDEAWAICRIETEHLLLRRWAPADAPALLGVMDASEAHLAAWGPWLSERPRTVEDQAQLLERFRSNFDLGKEFVFGVFSHAGECLGSVGLHRRVGPRALELGYWLARHQCGQGWGREMVAAACQAAFAAPWLERLEIHCAPDNLPSARIAARLGFRHDVTLADRLLSARGLHDAMIWSLWRAAPKLALAETRASGFDADGERVFPP